jgi:hypothetical protein
MLREPALRAGFAKLKDHGLSFDVWVMQSQLGDVYDLAKHHPDTTVVIDHVGGPMRIGRYASGDHGVQGLARRGSRELAQLPKTFVKLGGLNMPCTGLAVSMDAGCPWTSQQMADVQGPYVHAAIDLFGPDRCMFESNFPGGSHVDRGALALELLSSASRRAIRLRRRGVVRDDRGSSLSTQPGDATRPGRTQMNTTTAETYDFIIIGSGAASVCAALVAQAAGKRALIVEKTNLFGGSTSMSGGVLWIPNSRQMHEAGVTDSYELARTYIDACVGDAGPASSPERRHAYLTEAPKAVEFVESHGMRLSYADGYSDYYEGRRPGGIARGRALEADLFDIRELGSWADRLRPNYFGAPILVHEASDLSAAGRTWASKVAGMRLAWRLFRNRTGARLVGCGAAVQGRMLQIALQHKVPIWLDTRVKGFVRTGNRVTGLVVERDGAETELTARHGVLLNSGGFARNLEMRQRYQPQPASIDWTNAKSR